MRKNRGLLLGVFAVCITSASVALPSATASKVSASSEAIPVAENVSRSKHILVANSATDYQELRSELVNAGAQILEEYSNIFAGAAVLVSVEQAQVLASDSRVKSIEIDQLLMTSDSNLDNSDVIPDAYIIELEPGVSMAVEEDVLAFLGNNVTHHYTQAIRGFAARLTLSEVKLLRTNPAVKTVDHDRFVQVSGEQLSPPWGLDRLDQQSLPLNSRYSYQGSGSGVTVYVVDSGINPTLSEFGGRVRLGYGGQDCDGHGTHVAGTVGSATYGVAKNVSLVSVRVLDCNGSGSTSTVIAGLEWVITDHAAGTKAVVNMSLGGAYNSTLNNVVTRVIDDGVVMAVAAGNESVSACTKSPASTPAAITVAASNSTDNRASFSNYGSCVDVFAPGVGIRSTLIGGGSGSYDGTSMASPHVAGAAAVLWSLNPTYSHTQVASALISSATSNKIVDTMGSPNRLLFLAPGSGVAPTAPTSVTAAVSAGTVTINWNAPTSSGTSAVTSYQVVTSGDSPVCSWSSGPLQCQTTSLAAGPYTFKVSASSAAGTSPYSSLSNEVSVSPIGNNDYFSSSRVISGASGTITDSNSTATRETGEPTTYGSTAHTKWYSITANSNGYLTVNTNGSSFDTVLGVFTGSSVSALTKLGADDDGGSSFASLVSVSVVSGTTYRIQVGAFSSGVTGSIILNWSIGNATCSTSPVNDNLACATSLNSSSGLISGSNTSATLETSEPQETVNICKSVWYKVTPNGSGTGTFHTSGSNFDTVLTIYRSSTTTGSYGSVFFVSENDDADDFTLTSRLSNVTLLSGSTYFIRVAGYSGSSCYYGSISFSWSVTVTQTIVPPGAPTNVTASPGTNSSAVAWSAPSSNGGSAISSYTVISSPGGLTCTTSSLTCNVTNLSNFVAYTFTVTARNSAGAGPSSAASNSVTLGYQNDNFSGAVNISSGVSYSNNSSATVESGEPDHAGVAGGKSMWFRYSSANLKSVVINTNGSHFDTVLAVYTSTVSPATLTGLQTIAENDDDTNGVNGSSIVSFVAQPNVVYFIAVDSYDSWAGPASGAITLNTLVQDIPLPGAPQRVIAASANGSSTVSWRKPSTNFSVITSYKVTSSPGGRTCETSAVVFVCSISGLTNGVSYTFTVVAINPAGSSQNSTPSNAVMPTTLEVTRSIASVWGIDRIDERQRTEDGFLTLEGRGQGTRIYVVDTGVRATHTDFTNRVAVGFTSISDGRGSSDCNGHGTHVASSAAGTNYGVASLATIVPVRVLDCDGSGTTDDVLRGLDWVMSQIQTTHNRAVVNMSLGGSFDESLNQAVRSIVALGVPVVAAAGNSARDACTFSPAGERLAITVAAATPSDEEAGYSNYGPCVDIFAPGSEIVAAGILSDTSTTVKSGTSMAAPHVAGYVAVVKGLFPSATSSAVANIISGASTTNTLTSVSANTVNRMLYVSLPKCDVAAYVNVACTVPVVAPAPAPAPAPVAPVLAPVVSATPVLAPLAPTTSQTNKTLVVTSKRPATFASVAKFAGVKIPKGSKVTASVPKSSAKNCKIKSAKIVVIKSGSCVVKVSVTPKGSKKAVTKTVKLTVKK